MHTADLGLLRYLKRVARDAGAMVVPPTETSAGLEERCASIDLRELWQEIGRVSADPLIGIKLARRGEVDQGLAATLAYASGTQATLIDGLSTFSRFYPVIDESVAVVFEHDEAGGRLVRRDKGSPRCPFVEVQFAHAAVLQTCSDMAGHAVVPREVWFAHHAPALEPDLEKAFGCPVRTGKKVDALFFTHDVLSQHMTRHNPVLAQVLKGVVGEIAARVPHAQERDLVAQIRQDVADHLAQDVTLTGVAGRLGIHERTLQRRLKDVGTSHKEIVDEIRQNVAVQQLAATDRSMGEIAFLLGFSEQAAFTRAFKKWTGKTPGAYRRTA